jgi:hypothetical protein
VFFFCANATLDVTAQTMTAAAATERMDRMAVLLSGLLLHASLVSRILKAPLCGRISGLSKRRTKKHFGLGDQSLTPKARRGRVSIGGRCRSQLRAMALWSPSVSTANEPYAAASGKHPKYRALDWRARNETSDRRTNRLAPGSAPHALVSFFSLRELAN